MRCAHTLSGPCKVPGKSIRWSTAYASFRCRPCVEALVESQGLCTWCSNAGLWLHGTQLRALGTIVAACVTGVCVLQEALKRLHEDQAEDDDTRSGFYVNTSDHTGRKLFVLVRPSL